MAASIDFQTVRITKALRAASPILIAVGLPSLILTILLWTAKSVLPISVEDSASAHHMSQLNHGSDASSPTSTCSHCAPDDAPIDRRLDSLQPQFLSSLRVLLQTLEHRGYNFHVVETFRSFQRQELLWQQGRYPQAPGPIVTVARPGHSLHEKGLAADLAPLIQGKISWDLNNPSVQNAFQVLGQQAKALGLRWGGDWTMADYGHVELSIDDDNITGQH